MKMDDRKFMILQAIIDEGKEIEVKCHFCNTDYTYSIEEVKFLMQQAMLKSAAKKLGMSEKTEEKPQHDH